jgi:L-iditol 2-dehydrogenase
VLPGSTDPCHAALAEPLSCCIHATDRADIRPGDRAVILGGGVIGLLCLHLRWFRLTQLDHRSLLQILKGEE